MTPFFRNSKLFALNFFTRPLKTYKIKLILDRYLRKFQVLKAWTVLSRVQITITEILLMITLWSNSRIYKKHTSCKECLFWHVKILHLKSLTQQDKLLKKYWSSRKKKINCLKLGKKYPLKCVLSPHRKSARGVSLFTTQPF